MSDRIAVISTSYPREPGDASGHFVACEVARLVRAGHQVEVFAPGSGQRSWGGARMHWLGDRGAFGWPGALPRLKQNPTRAFGMTEFVLRARNALARERPFAQVHAHFLVPCAWPIALSAVKGAGKTALEIVGHGSDVRVFCRLPRAVRARIAAAWLARHAELRVTSDELRALLGAANPELCSILRVAPSPIDVTGVPARGAARQALAVTENERLALVVARLIPEKRVALALQALTQLEGVSVIVVGDGPEFEALRARFPRVRFTGRLPRPETLRFIAAADVLVSASPDEGAPTVVREARQLGVPVVAVAAGDLAAWARTDPGIRLVGG